MDNREITELYTKYGPMVLRRCLFLLKSRDLAEDAMQEVFMKVISKKDSLNIEYPSSLFYKIATNICLNILKKNKSLVNNSTEEIAILLIASEDNFVDKIISSDLIERIFHLEPSTTRLIAVMHYIDKMTLEETAKNFGMSVSGIRKRLRNLSLKARSILEQEGETI